MRACAPVPSFVRQREKMKGVVALIALGLVGMAFGLEVDEREKKTDEQLGN